ncbi:MAG: 30S ribosomal protein S12 methylthiotransferase RimO [Lachnospiraceae bacterium]|nr:30S ribosomal protein S12 methylthiotransferase RimO [Lachnospiraceae bacterium]
MNETVYFLSLGCDKNLSDSEHMLGLLRDAGYRFTDDETQAEVAVVNTCCFIGDAKKESIAEILRLSQYKEDSGLKALVVTGCLSERYASELEKELPEIDGALGIGSWDRIAEVVSEALEKKHPHVFDSNSRNIISPKRVLTTGGHYACLKIAEGCDKYCTYCVIPYVRGRYRSVPMEDLAAEAEFLAEGGVKELILVAQETTLYGTDLYGKKMLPELLRRLSEIKGIEWIRLMYCYPEEVTEELLLTMKALPKVLHYLDIPIQHASDEILKRMNRRTNRAELTEKIRMMREIMPDIALRTTLISGFPGETPEDHKESCELVREIRFDRLGVFCYSREENTPAAEMDHQVPEREKKKRRNALMRIQQEIAFENAERMIGRTLDVMIEGRVTDEIGILAGRSYLDAPEVDGLVFVETDADLLTGTVVSVKITASRGYDLIGEIVE